MAGGARGAGADARSPAGNRADDMQTLALDMHRRPDRLRRAPGGLRHPRDQLRHPPDGALAAPGGLQYAADGLQQLSNVWTPHGHLLRMTADVLQDLANDVQMPRELVHAAREEMRNPPDDLHPRAHELAAAGDDVRA